MTGLHQEICKTKHTISTCIYQSTKQLNKSNIHHDPSSTAGNGTSAPSELLQLRQWKGSMQTPTPTTCNAKYKTTKENRVKTTPSPNNGL